jgi:septal ring factor EnvC (AmiA/AmiB activator)
MRAALLICLLALSGLPAVAQDAGDVDALTKAEQAARDKAKQLDAERQAVREDISKLKADLGKAARRAQSVEVELVDLERQTENLTARVERLEAQITADRAQYIELIAALQRLEATPPPTIALTPRDAQRAAQAGQLMAGLSEQIRTRADALTLNVTALNVTREQLAQRQGDLSLTRQTLVREKADVQSGLDAKTELETQIADQRSAADAEAKRLAAESANLLELIAKLEAEAAVVVPRRKPGTTARPSAPVDLPKGVKKFADAKGQMLRPVTGSVIKKFGRGEKGMTFAGRTSGQVLAPYAGRVEFSGPFKNYDQVVILNVGGGYFVLLTGLSELFIGTGDDIRRGEPLGQLPGGAKPELYIELRRNGRTLDPAPWLAKAGVKTG